MSGAMNRHCIPGLTVPSPDGELFCGSVQGIIKTMHTGFSAYTALHYANMVLTRKSKDVMI